MRSAGTSRNQHHSRHQRRQRQRQRQQLQHRPQQLQMPQICLLLRCVPRVRLQRSSTTC
jgi:hypothetical protein